MEKLLERCKENKTIIALFLISTLFFIYQHRSSVTWDFSAYVLNAQYWFSGGAYFEPLRPPLMPFLLGVFSFLGWKAAEYVFIIFVSVLFLYSSLKLSEALKFDPTLFYLLSLNPYVLVMGLLNGTELLSFVFLELFLWALLKDRSSSGIFLGLACLSRYSMLCFLPLILFHRNLKKIIKSLFFFSLSLSPWLAYNFYKFGNFFTSIADQYANNILYRGYIVQHFNFFELILVPNVLLPFFLFGIFIAVKKLTKNLSMEKSKAEILMFLILAISLYSFFRIPIKSVRYLFPLILPVVYFSYLGVKKSKAFSKVFSISLIMLSLVTSFLWFSSIPVEPLHLYSSSIDTLNKLNLTNCSVSSNAWVMLNYLGKHAIPYPRRELVNSTIQEGYVLLLFKSPKEPKYVLNETFISSLPVVFENNRYVIIFKGGRCKPPEIFDKTYLEQVNDYKLKTCGKGINHNPCFTVFHDFSTLEALCNFINFKGFKVDEYRYGGWEVKEILEW